MTDATVHANCLVLDEAGILLRGEAGAGKSSLCLELLDMAERDGRHAALVGDDHVRLDVCHGRLVGRPHPVLAGLIEVRGLGIRRMARPLDAAVIRLVADLVLTGPRLPVAATATVEILGVRLPALRLYRDQPRAYLIRQALAAAAIRGVASRSHPAPQFDDIFRDT